MLKIRIIALASVLILFSSIHVYADDLTVAAAANLQSVLEELKAAFERDSDATVKTVTGSSGKLTAQIENGAPFDIFLSADMKYPETLYKEGLSSRPPRVYAYGVLVLWSTRKIDLSQGVNVLKDAEIGKIALANPQTAPYGREAVNAMKFYNLYQEVYRKFVYGESIAQTNDFVVSQSADIGFTAKSTVLSPNLKEKGVWMEVPAESYHRIAQGGIVLKYGEKNHPRESREFFDFLFSPRAGEIFKRYGYTVNE